MEWLIYSLNQSFLVQVKPEQIRRKDVWQKLPKQYLQIKKALKIFQCSWGAWQDCWERPLDERTAHLFSLQRRQRYILKGAVHSHVEGLLKRVTPEEIYHAIILLTSTIGFPTVVAALSWADDVIKAKKK